MKIFIEYGLDFDNNKYGLGRSVEVENEDGTEYRTKEKIKLKEKSYYFRFWIFKKSFVIDGTGFKILTKSRNNLKIIFGIEGGIADAK